MRLLSVLLLTACATIRPPSTETVERTTARLHRGVYLATAVADCVECHSPRDWSQSLGPVKPGLEAAGGDVYDSSLGFPGEIVPSNITTDAETGVGSWTDGELLRALREGVSRDGRVLFPYMPYPSFRALSDEDARSLVVWVRSLPPVKHEVPKTHIKFPVSVFIRGAAKPVEAPVLPPNDDEASRGRYLVTIAGCRECHSPVKRGQVVEDRAFSGGRTFTLPGFTCTSPNLTPAPGTFVASASKEQFIARVRTQGTAAPVATSKENSVMPWRTYAHMTDDDLGAVWAYLKALPAIAAEPSP